jgi:hypothetical protein
MAVIRTILPRKGIIQPRHGDNYESDLDHNWQIIDAALQDANDVQAAILNTAVAQWLQDISISGVVSGFNLSSSSTLAPALACGVLYAQGIRFCPQAPAPPPAPANSTRYLWYNCQAGFYYTAALTPQAVGDALLGTVTTDSTRVISASNATKVYGFLPVTSPDSGNFTLPHNLGRTPVGAQVSMTSPGAIWFQTPLMFDSTSLYLSASDTGLSASVQVW